MNYIRNENGIRLLGRKIRQLRNKAKISQAQLAFEANIPREQVGRIERGIINTGVSTLFEIAKALNVDVKTLFDFDDLRL